MDQAEGLGFTYRQTKKGEIIINRFGKKVTILRNNKAISFIEDIQDLDFDEQQNYMARLTGNYKRGNERTAKNHFRNKK